MKNSLFVIGAGIMLLGAGCTNMTVSEIMDLHEKELTAVKFGDSVEEMQKRVQEDEKNTNEDTPMWCLMLANSQMLTNQKDEAIKGFDKAEDIFLAKDQKKKDPVAMLEEYAPALAFNDQVLTFNASHQERMFIGLDKALIYAGNGKYDEARNEFNRMMQYQENWLFDRKNEIAASESAAADSFKPADTQDSELPPVVVEEMNKLKAEAKKTYEEMVYSDTVLGLLLKHCNIDLKNCGDLSKLKPEDYQNAYATHLCGVYRWLNKDGGAEYLKDAAKLKPASKVIAADYSEAEKSVMPKDEVWVYVEDGLCPKRSEVRIDLPIVLIPFAGNYVQYFGIALPSLVLRDAAAEKYTVAGMEMEELESIDRLMKIEHDVYMFSATKRELLRALLKTIPQVAAGIAADQVHDPMAKLGCKAAQTAAAVYAKESTLADLRTWNILPKRVFVQRVKRPADGIIKLTADDQVTEINVPAGNSIVWVRKVGKNSPFVIQQINFAEK